MPKRLQAFSRLLILLHNYDHFNFQAAWRDEQKKLFQQILINAKLNFYVFSTRFLNDVFKKIHAIQIQSPSEGTAISIYYEGIKAQIEEELCLEFAIFYSAVKKYRDPSDDDGDDLTDDQQETLFNQFIYPNPSAQISQVMIQDIQRAKVRRIVDASQVEPKIAAEETDYPFIQLLDQIETLYILLDMPYQKNLIDLFLSDDALKLKKIKKNITAIKESLEYLSYTNEHIPDEINQILGEIFGEATAVSKEELRRELCEFCNQAMREISRLQPQHLVVDDTTVEDNAFLTGKSSLPGEKTNRVDSPPSPLVDEKTNRVGRPPSPSSASRRTPRSGFILPTASPSNPRIDPMPNQHKTVLPPLPTGFFKPHTTKLITDISRILTAALGAIAALVIVGFAASCFPALTLTVAAVTAIAIGAAILGAGIAVVALDPIVPPVTNKICEWIAKAVQPRPKLNLP